MPTRGVRLTIREIRIQGPGVQRATITAAGKKMLLRRGPTAMVIIVATRPAGYRNLQRPERSSLEVKTIRLSRAVIFTFTGEDVGLAVQIVRSITTFGQMEPAIAPFVCFVENIRVI